MTAGDKILENKTFLGIEFGSTRIKASLIDDNFVPVAEGSCEWENRFENGYWTYSLDDVINGLQKCYASLAADVAEKYGVEITSVAALGISGMMHGYLPFDKHDNLLVPFRTWRNTTTSRAADELTRLFEYNIPQRWSIAHLYQAILDCEEHISRIAYINTLAGLVHYLLTGRRVLGVGEASGMFPVENGGYNRQMLEKFDKLLEQKGLTFTAEEILPEIMSAGESGSVLTENGARLLDPTGRLKSGITLCPPEGDAGTGMTATNSIKPATGNVSAGTSIFSMLVLEKPLKGVYPQIDVVATPDGMPTAMVHCNNCCGELDAWVNLFDEFATLLGIKSDKSALYEMLYKNSLNGSADCSGITAYNFMSGEPVAGVENGVPLVYRTAGSTFSLANFFRAQIYSAFASLKLGNDILFENEGAKAEHISAHGGLFKVGGVAQQYLADGLSAEVTVTETAGEGGAWGMAILAAYTVKGGGKALAQFLDEDVFAGVKKTTLKPTPEGEAGFRTFMERYKRGIELIHNS